MRADRFWIGGSALAVVVVLALAWVFGVQPRLAQVDASQTQLEATQAVNAAQAARVQRLAAEQRTLPALQQRLAASDAALPADPGAAAFLGELGDLERSTHVTLTGYTATAATAVAPATPTPAPSTAATPAPSATPTPSPSVPTTGAPAAATTTTPAASALVRLPVQLQASGSYHGLVAFLGGLQSGRRLFGVDRFAITAAPSGGYTADITGSVYVLPESAG